MKSIVRDAQAPLRARYRDDPRAAFKTYRLRSSGRELHTPFTSLVTSLEGCGAGTSFRMSVDPLVGGPGCGPTTGDVLLASLAGCRDTALRMVANALGIELCALDVEVVADIDARGTMLVADAEVRFTAIAVHTRIAVAAGTPPEAVERLLETAEKCCIITATLRNPPPIASHVTVEAS